MPVRESDAQPTVESIRELHEHNLKYWAPQVPHDILMRELTEDDLLGVSADTVRRLTDAGHLPSSRLPSGYRRFDIVDVLAFKASLRTKVAAP